MSVVIAGGGSAGHVEPAMALADALRRRDPDLAISAVGTARGLETRLVPARGYPLDLIPPVPLPRRLTLDLLRVPWRLAASVRAARQVLARRDASVVVGFGGYVALPVYLAARRSRTPVVVHEANAKPGLANRVGARRAVVVAVTVPGTALPRAVLTGVPIRREIATLDRAARRADARRAFGLAADMPCLLVTGGSQGARRINEAAVAVAADLTAHGVQLLHITGSAHADSVRAALPAGLTGESAPYVVASYVDGMADAYAAADVALCRSGAMTCAEVTAVGLPAVFVPLPHGNGEQRLNAAPVVAAGGGLLVDDSALDGGWLRRHVLPLLADESRLAAMSKAASALGRPTADDELATLVLDAMRGAT